MHVPARAGVGTGVEHAAGKLQQCRINNQQIACLHGPISYSARLVIGIAMLVCIVSTAAVVDFLEA